MLCRDDFFCEKCVCDKQKSAFLVISRTNEINNAMNVLKEECLRCIKRQLDKTSTETLKPYIVPHLCVNHNCKQYFNKCSLKHDKVAMNMIHETLLSDW